MTHLRPEAPAHPERSLAARGARSSGPGKLRWVALATTLTFGCATVRVPAGGIADPVPVRDGVPEPQVALWIEDTKRVSPEESRRASETARAAIAQAIEGRTDYEGDAVLVVRAQGVTRTPARRKDQKLAIAGLVVGSVAVVAVVVAAVVASKGKGAGAPKPKAAPKPAARGAAVAAASGARPAPRPASRGVRPAPPPGSAAPAPARRATRGGGVVVVPHVGVWIDASGRPTHAPLPASSPGDASAVPESVWGGGAAEDGPGVAGVSLAPPPELPLAERGFFAGDELLVELVLVDRHDGTPLWRKVVRRDVNPCDAREVRRVMDEALGSDGWMPAADVFPE
jgi:hypothetical protein